MENGRVLVFFKGLCSKQLESLPKKVKAWERAVPAGKPNAHIVPLIKRLSQNQVDKLIYQIFGKANSRKRKYRGSFSPVKEKCFSHHGGPQDL